MKKLNLGSGEYPKEGFVNVDFYSVSEPDVKHDLTHFPYPFAEDYFDWIESDHCLEHLPDPFSVMREIHRIGKPGATVIIRVPHFSRGFTHAEHKSGFDVTFPYYFKKGFPGGYQGVEFDSMSTRLTWFAQPYFKKQVLSMPAFYVARTIGIVLNFFANLSVFACSRIWCFWVGGFEEVEFRLRIKK
ncbi:MAG TPA: methyltransferase domain-containing protein [Chryseosolibacter sp.]|nr:methyltransferase domain-containing protein [Chryseosolibacter sp.]